MAKAAKEVA
jgi:hypothetical protein